MSTADSANRRPTTWVSILLLSLLVSTGCGGAAGETDDGLGADELAQGFDDDELSGDEVLGDEMLGDELPDDEVPDEQDRNPVEPATGDGRDPATPPNTDGGRTLLAHGAHAESRISQN